MGLLKIMKAIQVNYSIYTEKRKKRTTLYGELTLALHIFYLSHVSEKYP